MMVLKRLFLCLVLLGAVGVAEDAERKTVVREEPEYPEVARKNNLHGTVRLKLWITPAGTVRRLEYIGGHPVLAETALAAVKKWKFETGTSETEQVVSLKF